ncbi:hypothetical protein AN396_02395 [Candidatus Epulonipiscium fishelsonii]|uniref:Uncharacterized protein n=1 Tax=Candidatus Epulonipiscium fishelsonii TaxID=77094 RepID=A0ACC8XFL1_9FIRM|nr:hypothetical protein AN396_02395 [Epulopiscium sp. SCG-B11WGA-EpuloA1]
MRREQLTELEKISDKDMADIRAAYIEERYDKLIEHCSKNAYVFTLKPEKIQLDEIDDDDYSLNNEKEFTKSEMIKLLNYINYKSQFIINRIDFEYSSIDLQKAIFTGCCEFFISSEWHKYWKKLDGRSSRHTI